MFSSMRSKDLLKRNENDTGMVNAGDNEIIEDIEDFQNQTGTKRGPRPVVRSYEVNNNHISVEKSAQKDQQQADSDEKGDQSQNMVCSENIDKDVDYQGWLEMKKRKWKDTLNMRKKQRYGT